ncbi:MAG TPA: hypothetical protein GX513_15235, partial [Firmicutes bacterium]|nr:hypothetical protein [Bacillota bacterium]
MSKHGVPAELYEAIVAVVDERVAGMRGQDQSLEAALRELTEAQTRTEKSVEKLVQVQVRSEQRLDRVEVAVEKLVQA